MTEPENTAGKQRGKPFQKGQSGNPDGRPKGSRNATTLALETLLDGQATALTQKAIDLALIGDMAALRICMDRILPPRKDRPITFDFLAVQPLNFGRCDLVGLALPDFRRSQPLQQVPVRSGGRC